MSYRKTFILLLLSVASLFSQVGFSQAGRIAVLPLEDLSLGSNGLDMVITRQVREGMARRGFAMVSHDEVIDFMVRNRVRWLGHLGSQYVRRIKKELGVDYIVLGSVNQRRDKSPFALGLTLQVVRTGDAQIIWAHSAELCGADEIRLLGLAEPRDMAEMEGLVVQQALLAMPENLQEYGRPLEIRDTIESVFVGPEIIKPGDTVHCRVKLGAQPRAIFETSVSIFVDERIIEAQYLEKENAFVASWPAALNNERYPVSIAISRPGSMDREVLVGSYLVDGQVPALALQLKGQELDGMVILQKKVAIMPVMKKPEPIKRWLMTVHDKNGLEIMTANGQNGLPARFAWWGQTKNGGLVADGFYTIGLKVWDRAGNSASADEVIRVIRREPKMSVAMKEQEENLALSLEYDGEIPLAYWRLEVQNQDGDIISQSSGTDVDSHLMLPLATVAGQNISYRLYAQDMLGNRMRREVKALVPLDQESGGDDGDFLAEAEGQKVALREIWAEDF